MENGGGPLSCFFRRGIIPSNGIYQQMTLRCKKQYKDHILIHSFVIRIGEDECMKREGIIFLSVISHVMPLLDDWRGMKGMSLAIQWKTGGDSTAPSRPLLTNNRLLDDTHTLLLCDDHFQRAPLAICKDFIRYALPVLYVLCMYACMCIHTFPNVHIYHFQSRVFAAMTKIGPIQSTHHILYCIRHYDHHHYHDWWHYWSCNNTESNLLWSWYAWESEGGF